MANATSVLRMSGMNSGLDTESIVNALTATTKNKINTNQRTVLKLQAQQEAYRSVISAFTAFQDKYLNILNLNTCLKSGSLFNSYKGTLSNASGTIVNGVTVSSSTTANEAVYEVDVHKVATQSTLKSASASGKAADFSQCTDPTQDYTMTVTVGGKTQNIVFKGGSDDDAIRANINDALKSAFGVRNDNSGIVSIGTDNKISSSDQSAVTTTTPTIYTTSRDLNVNVNDMQTGNNTFSVTVGNETKTVTFSTVSKDYFDEIFETDDDGNFVTDANGNYTIKEDADFSKVSLFQQVALNERTGDVYDKFAEYEENMTDDDKEAFAKAVWDFKEEAELADVETRYRQQAIVNIRADINEEYNNFCENGGWSADGDTITGDLSQFSAATREAFDNVLNDYYEKAASGEIVTDPDEEGYISAKDYFDKYFTNSIQVSDDAIDDYLANNEEGQAINEDMQEALDEVRVKYEGKVGEDGEEDVVVEIPSFDELSQTDKITYFDKRVYESIGGQSAEDYIAGFTAAEAVKSLNTANIQNNLGALSFSGELVNIKATVNDDGTVTISGEGQLTGSPREFAITQAANNATDFGIDTTDSTGIANQISTTAKLSELGLTPNEDGNYTFSINGVDFSFTEDTTVSDMMKKVNASEAGVKMSYTTLTNQFIITSTEYGKGQQITFQDGAEGLLDAFGFNAGATFTEGQNTVLTVNGVDVETTSNSYTVDGTTFTFTAAAEGTSFTNDVKRDYSKAINAIKSFVEDYNKLIDDIYAYVDDEPNSDYYFLTDDDIEEMDLSESQQNKWETLAKKGLLYRDSNITNLMTKLRTAIYSAVDAPDGTKVGLYTLGITTTSSISDHGKLQFDASMTDEQFEATFAKYADEFAKLFNDTEKGIAYQFDSIIDSGCKTSGDPKACGSLVLKAGVSGTSSATTNSIYTQIQSLKTLISSLQERYEQQQERYWSIYSNMETMLGNINSQSSYIQQLTGSM